MLKTSDAAYSWGMIPTKWERGVREPADEQWAGMGWAPWQRFDEAVVASAVPVTLWVPKTYATR